MSRPPGRGGRLERLRQLEFILDVAPAFIAYVDTDERYRFNNKRYEDLFGAARGSLYGRHVAEVLGGTAYAAARPYIQEALSGCTVTYESPVALHLDGRERRFIASYAPDLRDDGSVAGLVALVIDDSERKRAEGALRRSEAEYRALVEYAPYGIYRSTTAGRFVTVNLALVQMLGYESEADVLQIDLATDLWVDPGAPGRLVEQFQAAERIEALEVEWKRKDGRAITVRLAGRARTGPEGDLQFFEMIVEDVTESRRLQAQLYQSQKMEAVGILAGGMAHDFNNLLTVIGGYSELLLEGLAPQDPGRGDVLEIKHAAERAASLTRQLLAVSRKQLLQPRVLDLNAVVADFETMLRRLIGEDIQLVTNAGSELGRVKADRGQIEQVLMNLAVNARDAMPGGGKLTLETANAELDETYLSRHVAAKPGPSVMLAVSDTGIGMDAETQTRIFEPFFTTKEKGKGTGLGLATVYGIVKQSGGYIRVYSEPGHGATFKIYLPRVDDPVDMADAVVLADPPPRGSETVLLVEDEQTVRSVVRRTLETNGYIVLEALCGDEALSIGQQHQGPIHLLLTDVSMPVNGRELAGRLAVVRPQIKILYMSGYADDAVIRHGVLQPNEAFLQKPFGPGAVARKVREVLDTPPRP